MKLSRLMLNSSLLVLMPVVANAAGTYYNRTYQTPQNSYAGNYYTPSYTASRYNSYNNNTYANTINRTAGGATGQNVAANTTGTGAATSDKSGFWLDAGVAYQMAAWQFDMTSAGSHLHYDNLGWTVLDIGAGYSFDLGKVALQIDAGFQYGIQVGESSMIDDDISHGGYFINGLCEDINKNGVCDKDEAILGDQWGYALSAGTSQGGNMLGFNVGVGLTDVFKIGNLKFTPSIGYRYLQYHLTTEDNSGLTLSTFKDASGGTNYQYCYTDAVTGEYLCMPITFSNDGTTDTLLTPNFNEDGAFTGMTGATGTINTPNTLYFKQPGISHSYDVSWSGPYIAMDMGYDINQNNFVNARVELGFPGYTATGDQPYRLDWQHPTSVEDTAGMFGALHLGLAANWSTALTNSVALTFGLTYDYYTVSGADANTYWNRSYYEQLMVGADENTTQAIQNTIDLMEADCPGGVCVAPGEVDSVYKSMGVRIGIDARF